MVKVFSTDRACFLRKNGECIRSRCGPAMSRTTVDKLELRLALFEYDGVFHSLTFAPENLPANRKEVQQIWNTYLKRLKRWGSGRPVDYVYRIEGLHDSLHIHVFLRNSEYPAVLVRRLWDWARPTMYHTQKRRSSRGRLPQARPDILPKSGRRSGSTRGGRRGRSSPKCRCQRSRPARPAVSTSRGMRSSCRSSTTRQKATGACTHTASI